MEDICYFLVGKIEGQSSNLKKIFPTYPCTQPSDTVAFRTTLTKYMETLKSDALRSPVADPTSNANASSKAAWWWKEVIIRKSTLEECGGERFEKLMLALSTQALLKCTPNEFLGSALSELTVTSHEAILGQIDAYSKALAAFKDSRRVWEHSANDLTCRQDALTALRSMLNNPEEGSGSKYINIPTDKLLAVQDSRVRDIREAHWMEGVNANALDLVLSILGLPLKNQVSSRNNISAESSDTEHLNSAAVDPKSIVTPSPPLPIAAAHHPTHLKGLRQPVLPNSLQRSSETADSDALSHDNTLPLIAERLKNEAQKQQALREALTNAQRQAAELEAKLQASKPVDSHVTRFRLDLSTPSNTNVQVVFKSFVSGNSTTLDHQSKLEARIVDTRDNLPAWPSTPDLYSEPSPSPPPSPKLATRLPQATNVRKPAITITRADSQCTMAIAGSKIPHLPSRPMSSSHIADPSDANQRKSLKKAGRKSNALMRGRARRSSAFVRRKTGTYIDEDFERFANEAMNDSTSSAETDLCGTPRPKITKGTPLTPLSNTKMSVPRPSFDMESHERAMTVPLPRLSLDSHDEALVAEDEEEVYEGNSMTLKEILLKADVTQFDLLREDDLEDETFEW
ncbi:unnamed protein product [Somion occarium]